VAVSVTFGETPRVASPCPVWRRASIVTQQLPTNPHLRQVGLPDDELHVLQALHRGVFCRPGLLVPSDSTVFHLCPAQHFNAHLPLGPQRPYKCLTHARTLGALCFRVR
jgi:hypothetical protein